MQRNTSQFPWSICPVTLCLFKHSNKLTLILHQLFLHLEGLVIGAIYVVAVVNGSAALTI